MRQQEAERMMCRCSWSSSVTYLWHIQSIRVNQRKHKWKALVQTAVAAPIYPESINKSHHWKQKAKKTKQKNIPRGKRCPPLSAFVHAYISVSSSSTFVQKADGKKQILCEKWAKCEIYLQTVSISPPNCRPKQENLNNDASMRLLQ